MNDRLSGTWCNQLGSRLILEEDGEGGLRGDYCSGTGLAAGVTYPLFGSYDPSPSSPSTVLGFVVDWTEAHCVTAWSGQYFPKDDTIQATWLMTSETDPGDEWKSTVVGRDRFQRQTATD